VGARDLSVASSCFGKAIEDWFRLLEAIKRSSVVYTDEFKSYSCVTELSYERLSAKHGDDVYALVYVHVNNAEYRSLHLRAFLSSNSGVSLALASFYTAAASAFLRTYFEAGPVVYH